VLALASDRNTKAASESLESTFAGAANDLALRHWAITVVIARETQGK
jgi:hypothetical protein